MQKVMGASDFCILRGHGLIVDRKQRRAGDYNGDKSRYAGQDEPSGRFNRKSSYYPR